MTFKQIVTFLVQDSNRVFISEKSISNANFNILNPKTLVVKNFPVVSIQQNETSAQVKSTYCQFGYFQSPQDDNTYICVQCPQSTQSDYFCVDCILNPLSWYSQSICTKDIISNRQVFYCSCRDKKIMMFTFQQKWCFIIMFRILKLLRHFFYERLFLSGLILSWLLNSRQVQAQFLLL